MVYWRLTQQQSGSYQGGDEDDDLSASLVEETGALVGNHLVVGFHLVSCIK